ncbi:MAG: tyrosinase family protein [Acidimicrobiales bacterium]
MAIRRDISTDDGARETFVRGVLLLKAEDTGLTTTDLGIEPVAGAPAQPLATWDLFVLWHLAAMNEFTPPGGGARNAAHMGAVFLPWHRWMLMLLEANLQRVLDDPEAGLPYWDWAADGELPIDEQPRARVWADDCMGGDGNPERSFELETGPFGAGAGFNLRITSDAEGQAVAIDRPLRRRQSFSRGIGLPTNSDVKLALELPDYDADPWDNNSEGFRNTLEGWVPSTTAPNLHNRVHVCIGGDMGSAASPNDPLFYLNHCNVDRIWAMWQTRNPDAGYLPGADSPEDLKRHRIADDMFSLFTDVAATPQDMLDVATIYSYDRLAG